MASATPKRLALISGNIFAVDPWGHHSAALWHELSSGFDEVHVFARSSGQHFHRSVQGRVTVHLIPRGPRPMATFVVSSWLVFVMLFVSRPTHVQAQSPVHGGLAAVAYGKVAGRPVMLEIHGEHYLRDRPKGRLAHRWFYRPLSAIAFRGATQLRSLSRDMTDQIQKVYGAGVAAKVVEIPNRVAVEKFSPPIERYQSADVLRVISVGSLVPNKNHLELIRALAAGPRTVELTLVGSGPLREQLETEAAKGPLDVHILGHVSHEDLPGILRTHDVYVQYSGSEAVSRAVLEAMAMGLPVVVSNVGFLGGIVDHMRSGLVLDRDESNLHAALEKLMDPQLRRDLGTEARRRIEENHEWSHVLDFHVQSLLAMSSSSAGPSCAAARRDNR